MGGGGPNPARPDLYPRIARDDGIGQRPRQRHAHVTQLCGGTVGWGRRGAERVAAGGGVWRNGAVHGGAPTRRGASHARCRCSSGVPTPAAHGACVGAGACRRGGGPRRSGPGAATATGAGSCPCRRCCCCCGSKQLARVRQQLVCSRTPPDGAQAAAIRRPLACRQACCTPVLCVPPATGPALSLACSTSSPCHGRNPSPSRQPPLTRSPTPTHPSSR